MYKGKIPKEKISQVVELISGLTLFQWGLIKSSIDYLYSLEIKTVKLDNFEEKETVLDNFLKL